MGPEETDRWTRPATLSPLLGVLGSGVWFDWECFLVCGTVRLSYRLVPVVVVIWLIRVVAYQGAGVWCQCRHGCLVCCL